MGLTNEQWKRLYNQAIEQRGAMARENAALRDTADQLIDWLEQINNDAATLKVYGDTWTQEQVRDCCQVIQTGAMAAVALVRSKLGDRPCINA